MSVFPEKRPTPRGLGLAGRRLWRALTADYALSEAEAVAVESACRLLDQVARMEAEMVNASVVETGSKGQPRAHPLLREIRDHRQAITRLLATAGLHDMDEHDATARSSAGRQLARKRWG